LPSTSQNHTIPVLPGVAELLSATRSPDAVPTYRTTDSSRPVTIAPPSPPNPPPVAPFVNSASTSTAPSGTRWSAYPNHARSHSSNQAHIPDQGSSTNYYSPYRRDADSARPHSSATSPGSQSLHSTVRSQSPMNSHRQDSAISHQRFDVSNEAQSSFPPSDVTSTSLRQSPIDSHQSTSPKPTYNPLTPPATYALKPLQPKLTSAEDRNHTTSNAPQEPAAAGSNTSSTDLGVELQPSNRTYIASGRQKFNVRFMANYTSENMPPAPRARPDISTLPPSPDGHDIEPPKHHQPLSPQGDLSPKTTGPNPPFVEEHLPLPDEYLNMTKERCSFCGDRWERPLPGANLFVQNKPTENGNDFGRSNMNLERNLQAHGRMADALHLKWLRRHWQCELRASSESLARPASPLRHSSNHTVLASSSNGAVSIDGPSTKRKLEVHSNDDSQRVTSKYRRVGPQPYSAAPTPTRPSTSP
jgi:hypothetical protein